MSFATCSAFRPAATGPSASSTSTSSSRPSPRSTPWRHSVVAVLPVKQGKKVTQIRVGWWTKEPTALREAWEELQRTKLGRRARVAGTAELVIAPTPSIGRLMRNERKTLKSDG